MLKQNWIEVKDGSYSGGGYTECSACGQRYSWGAYHEVNNFRYCPNCSSPMHINNLTNQHDLADYLSTCTSEAACDRIIKIVFEHVSRESMIEWLEDDCLIP